MAFSNGAPSIVQDGLVFAVDAGNNMCYPGTGATCTNLTGNITGSLQDDTAFSTEGGGSWYFDGTDDYIDIETSILSHISNVSTFSIGMWAKPKLSSDFMTLGYVDDVGAPRMNFGTWNNGNLIYNIGETGGATGCAIYKSYSNWDNWSYWVSTYDKTQGSFSDRLKGYVDGVDPGGWTESGNSGNNTGTITKFYLGYVGQWSSYAYGSYGPIQIYNRAITASEVLQNYNATKNRFQ